MTNIVVSFVGHPASVAPTQLLWGDRKAGKNEMQMNRWGRIPVLTAGWGLQGVVGHLLASTNLASQNMGFGQAALEPPGPLLETQILMLHPRLANPKAAFLIRSPWFL